MIYRPETCNLQAKIVLYPEQDIINYYSKYMVVKLASFVNSNSKTSQIELPMFKICYDIQTRLVKFTDSNKQLKRQMRDKTKMIDMSSLVNRQK